MVWIAGHQHAKFATILRLCFHGGVLSLARAVVGLLVEDLESSVEALGAFDPDSM